MMRALPTVGAYQRRVKEWTGWVVAALVGGGIALTFSIIFLAPGVVLLALGAGVAILGWIAGVLIPYLAPHRSLACPHCHQVSRVFSTSPTYLCDDCYREVVVAQALPVPQVVADEPATYTAGRRLLLLFTALSFVAFFVEVYLGHYLRFGLFLKVWKFSPALVPIFFSPIGLMISLATTVRLTPTTVRMLNAMALVSILIGIGGTYFHIAPRITELSHLLAVKTWLGDPPALAPFAYALPGIMGLIATYGLRWTERLPEEIAPRYEPASGRPRG